MLLGGLAAALSLEASGARSRTAPELQLACGIVDHSAVVGVLDPLQPLRRRHEKGHSPRGPGELVTGKPVQIDSATSAKTKTPTYP